MTKTPVRRLRRHLGARLHPRVERSAWYEAQWRRAADNLNLTVTNGEGGELVIGRLRARQAVTDVDCDQTMLRAGDKDLIKQLLDQAELPTPPTLLSVSDPSGFGRLASLRDRDDLVVKPLRGTGGGEGITVRPGSTSLFVRAVVEAMAVGRSGVLIEQSTIGRVVRVLVVNGKAVDTVERSPAAVVGDGGSTIAQLIAAENERRRALEGDATSFVPVTTDCLAALEAAGRSPGDVLPAGERCLVAGRSNTGSEQESVRIELCPEAKQAAEQATALLDGRLVGVDLVLDDDGGLCSVLEVNTTPGLHWHHLVADDPFPVFETVLADFA